MHRRSPWSLALVVALAAAAWQLLRPSGDADLPASRDESPALLFDRLWVDSQPEKHTDYVHAFFALSDAPLGVFQKASTYRLELEIFEHDGHKGQLRVRFPQTQKLRTIKYKVRHCDDLPPYDLCLLLSSNPWGGPKRYYSSVESDDAAATQVAALRARLEAASEVH